MKGYATVSVQVDTRALEELLRATPGRVDKAVRVAAYRALRLAKERCPVDTGALSNSLHVRDPLDPRLNTVAKVLADGVHYGIYQEMGTRYMPGKFFLKRSAEDVKPELEQAIRSLFE